MRKGITPQRASVLIGNYFPEIDDKLLNTLQLQNTHPDSELVLESIERKALQLKPFVFQKAIDFKNNQQYLKYLLLPIGIWLLTTISGKNKDLSGSYNRLVHHQQEYSPPAPFIFKLLNQTIYK